MHVEAVALLPQRESKDETVVSSENKKATKAETKPTYDQIKEYVMEKYGVKVSSLDVANAKNEFGQGHRLDQAKADRARGRNRAQRRT